MKAIKKDEHFTAVIEMTEVEVQTILDLFRDVWWYKAIPLDRFLLGPRRDIYTELKKLLESK